MAVLLMIVGSVASFTAGTMSAQTDTPTVETTVEPTVVPTIEPTIEPTAEPTTEPTVELTVEPTVAPPEEPTVMPTVGTELNPANARVAGEQEAADQPNPTEELSSVVVYKLFCASIDETAENPCIGRVEEAEGTKVDFVLTDGEFDFPFDVEIGVTDDGINTAGATEITGVPPGTYTVIETVPDGYDGFAVSLTESQVADGASVTFEVGAEAEEVLFVNVPISVEPTVEPTVAPTVEPTVGPTVEPTVTATAEPGEPTATVPPSIETPIVPPPPVTPEVTVPIEIPAVEPTAEVGIVILPNTGTSPTASGGAGWLVGLGGAMAVALLATGLAMRRRMGR
jgi:hypothetical protein